jgi:MoxR-like ATPase
VIVGKRAAIELLLVAFIADGHALIEDVPGLGKTLMAKSLAKTIGGSFTRVQLTPDLLPADITGFNIYNQQAGLFTYQSGPVITQSSLLESMEERQVTVDGQTHLLPRPFFVMATQNPIELEGTFPLPEAQLDRFLLKLSLGYPEKDEEISMLERFREKDPLKSLKAVASPEQITEMQDARKKIRISLPVREYIVDIVRATRESKALRFGASPRGSLGLMRTGQALAALRGRDFVLPDDIKHLVVSVLAHRLILTDEERLRGGTSQQLLEEILEQISVPAPTE